MFPRFAHDMPSSYTRAVNFNVYLDAETARRLDAIARATGTPRNALVRRALTAWLDRTDRGWPAIVLEYEGDEKMPAFESWRSELAHATDDPFSASTAHDRPRRKRR